MIKTTVSIPHRYSKKPVEKLISETLRGVSIPHRYSKKAHPQAQQLLPGRSFNSS